MSTTKQMKQLKQQVSKLQNQLSLQDTAVKNSLSTLVGAAVSQTALTSLNPILQNNIYTPLSINWTALTYMYKTHGIIQTAIDMPVLDAFRGGIELQSDELDQGDLKDLQDLLEEYGILDTIGEALIWTRLYGGGALVINTDQDPAEPLSLKRLNKLELYAASRWELGSSHRIAEHFIFYGKRVHQSRVITISGKAAPFIIRWQLQGWGMSEVERMVEDFNAYIKTKNVLYELLEEAKIDVYSLKGFSSLLASAVGTANAQRRIELVNQLKNFHRAIILDADDKYEQKQLTFAGLAEVMKENRVGIASALRIPMTKLFGLSASGFNSGEDDIENYNAMVESEVRSPARKVLRKVLKLLSILLYKDEFDIAFEYRPLRVLGAVEEEQVKTSKQNRYLALYDRQLMDSQEVGESLHKDKLVSVELQAEQGLLDPHPVQPGVEADPDDKGAGKGEGGAKKDKTSGKEGSDGAG